MNPASGNHPIALLPCLRWGNARWWLPLRAETAEVLAAAMVAACHAPLPTPARDASRPSPRLASDLTLEGAPPVNSTTNQQSDRAASALSECLRQDPALRTFTALRWLAKKKSRAGKRLTITRLEKWFRPRIVSIFADGDAALGQPPIDSVLWERWANLQRSQPSDSDQRFKATAVKWLEVAGPPVPRQWKACWPRLRLQAVDHASSHPGCQVPLRSAHLSLSQLARQIQSQQRLQDHFAAQLRQAKLTSLKQFAYGLSHEINNPLANIVTRTQQLQRDEPDPQRRQSMDRIVGQSMRAHEMIADVMFFAHPPQPHPSAVDLATIADQAMAMFQGKCAEASIALSGEGFGSDPVEIWADPSMLQEAIAALLRNAVEAVGCDGAIRVTWGRRGKRGQKAFVHVADSGPGISEEALRHAFDPYYSGREAGRGLGLGLCRAYRVAELHGGKAKLSSGAGGCVAKLWIPVGPRRSAATPLLTDRG